MMLPALLAVTLAAGAAGEMRAAGRPEQIAEGVYTIIHPDATENWPNGNTTIIIGSHSALVVDSGYLPATARGDIQALRALTDKPVRFLVNTHWHYDHTNGNAEYRRAFPDVQIVAHRETRRLLDANARRYARTASDGASAAQLGALRKLLAESRTTSGAPLSDPQRAEVQQRIAAFELEASELGAFRYEPPSMLFDTEIAVDLGGREVRIVHVGRGNTPGDTVVFLPKERVVIAGDLLVAPVPFCYYSFPREWVQTLARVRELDATVVVPGHGDVQRDWAYLDSVAELLRYVIAAVERSPGRTSDEVRRGIDLTAFRDRMAGQNPVLRETFEQSVVKALVERTFLSVRGGA